MAEFQAMAAILCSENVLGSFNLLFLGSHLSWPQIHFTFKRNLCNSFSEGKTYIQL